MRSSIHRPLVIAALVMAVVAMWSEARAAENAPAKVKEPGLRDEILRRTKEDQECRRLMMKLLSEPGESEPSAEIDWDALAKELELDADVVGKMKESVSGIGTTKLTRKTFEVLKKGFKIDRANTARMKEVVEKYGWPGRSLVGPEAAKAAWLLVQHADFDRPFQKRCLGLLEQAVKNGEAEATEFAYLSDRVLVGEKKKQIYGTQLEFENGTLKPLPIEDEANVDKRRREIGLEPLSDYLESARAALRGEGEVESGK